MAEVLYAIQAAGFAMNAQGKLERDAQGNAVRVPMEILDKQFAGRWEQAPDFQEVPPHLLADDRWRNVMSDRWFFSEGILLLEARAIVKAAERIANSIPQCTCRSLIFGREYVGNPVLWAPARPRIQTFITVATGGRFRAGVYFRWHPRSLAMLTKVVAGSISRSCGIGEANRL
jgi:hypothetical protein